MNPRVRPFLCVLALLWTHVAGRANPLPFLEPLPSRAHGASSVQPAAELYVVPAGRSPATWRPGQRWSMRLPSVSAVLCVSAIDHGEDGTVRVRGRLEGAPGSEVLLVGHEGAIAAIVRAGPEARPLSLVPLRPGIHHWIQPPEPPRCANGEMDSGEARDMGEGTDPRDPRVPHSDTGPLEDVILDVAFFHTRAAREGAGGHAGLRALVELAVLEANDAFARSAIALRIRPVGIREVAEPESGQITTDLERLVNKSDGWMDEVHALRDIHAADVVCLITESEDTGRYAGMARQLRSTHPPALENGFLVCVRPYLVGNYTLPHEIGHVLGGNHDRDNSGGSGLDPWSHGTRIAVEGETYRTVMAYSPGIQFPHFSNPRVTWRGVPTGAHNADNARTLNATAPLVAAVREPPARAGFEASALEVLESSGSIRVGWRLAGEMPDGASFRLRTRAATAAADVDFTPVDVRVSPTNPPVEILVTDNAVADGPRQFVVELSEPSEGLALGPVSAVSVTILDDELHAASALDASFAPSSGADHVVKALALQPDGSMIAAGGFTTFGGVPRHRIVRLLPDGSPDPDFRPVVKYGINAMALLPDGRIAIAGEFNTVNQRRLDRVGVLLPDGSTDLSFDPADGADDTVHALVADREGRLLLGGRFRSVRSRPIRHLARLLPDGRPDPDFQVTAPPDDEVLAVAIDAEDRILAGGRFAVIRGVPSARLARLGPDGAPDTAFLPAHGVDGAVHAILPHPDGSVTVAGEFSEFHSVPMPRVARLRSDGTLDPGFDPGSGPNGPVHALHPASDGRVWIAGGFTAFDGVARNRVARLLPDGSPDPDFIPGPGPDDGVFALSDGPGGTLAIGGIFTRVDGFLRGGVATLIVSPVGPPRFTAVTISDAGLEWEAAAPDGQPHELETTSALAAWDTNGILRATNGVLRGALPARDSASPHRFLRLRRILR